MDFINKFKSFLGFPQRRESSTFDNRRTEPPFQRGYYEEEDETDEMDHFGHHRTFNIFTDPLEIHKYFEQQMSDMLRNFGFSEFGDGFSHLPQIGDIPSQYEEKTGELRDQFLKPGYEKAIVQGSSRKKVDEDIDGKLNMGDLDSIFDGNKQRSPQVAPKTQFFGQSVTSKTIRNGDGSIETHRTVRDSQGNEETTVTRKIGDKEYSLTKRRDKDGKEETIENLVNLDESEISKFFPNHRNLPELDDKPSSLYDRFFK